MDSGRANPWIGFRWARAAPAARLFCLPCAGGGALSFRGLTAKLAPGIEVCAVELPGRGGRHGEAPATELSALVASLAAGLESELDLPFAIYGHSMGGLIGFELVRRWAGRGRRPQALIVAATRAPHLSDRRPPMASLSEEEFRQRLRELGGLPENVWRDAAMLGFVLELLKADFALCDGYRHVPGARLGVPIVALGGEQDPLALLEEVEAWRQHSSERFLWRMFPGGHFFIQDWIDAIAEVIDFTLLPTPGRYAHA